MPEVKFKNSISDKQREIEKLIEKEIKNLDLLNEADITKFSATVKTFEEIIDKQIDNFINQMSEKYVDTYYDFAQADIEDALPKPPVANVSSFINETRRELKRMNAAYYEGLKTPILKLSEKFLYLQSEFVGIDIKKIKNPVNNILLNGVLEGKSVAEVGRELRGYLKFDEQIRLFTGDPTNWSKSSLKIELWNPETGKLRTYNFRDITDLWANKGMSDIVIQAKNDTWINQGEDIVIVNFSDSRCCPLCLPWQGIRLSLTGKTKGMNTLAVARASGLFHFRCRHDISLWDSSIDAKFYRGDSPIFDKNNMNPSQAKLFENAGIKVPKSAIKTKKPKKSISGSSNIEKNKRNVIADDLRKRSRKFEIGELKPYQKEKGLSREFMRTETGGAFGWYQNAGFQDINSYLRSGNWDKLRSQESEITTAINLMDDHFQKSKIPEPLTVFRGISGKMNVKPGQIVKDKGYCSTSLSEISAGGFGTDVNENNTYMKIFMEKKSKAVIMPNYQGEHEVLLPRNAILEVVKVEDFDYGREIEFIYKGD